MAAVKSITCYAVSKKTFYNLEQNMFKLQELTVACAIGAD